MKRHFSTWDKKKHKERIVNAQFAVKVAERDLSFAEAYELALRNTNCAVDLVAVVRAVERRREAETRLAKQRDKLRTLEKHK